MLTLGIDTALKSCSVAILQRDAVLANLSIDMEKGHAEHLAPMVAEALNISGVWISDVDRVGVVIGPGSFTGVRVGLAFARALALGTRAQVFGFTSLEVLAAPLFGKDEWLVASVVDARRGQVYAALYDGGKSPVTPPFVAAPEEAMLRLVSAAQGAAVRLIGDGAALLTDVPANFSASGASIKIESKLVARLAADASAPKAPPSPVYLRPPDALATAPSLFEGLLERDC